MSFKWVAGTFAALSILRAVVAQCPNEVALYNPNVRTQTENGTWFLVPVNSTAVQTALDGTYGSGEVLLGLVPTTDKTLFPEGFPAGYHPVVVFSAYSDDIRMAAFQIDGPLIGGQVYAPYVRRPTSNASTVLTAEITGYLAGEDNSEVAGLVPSTVSDLVEGFPTRLGLFEPDDAAYQLNSGGVLSNKVAWNVATNPVSGPGINPEAADFQYTGVSELNKTTLKLFKVMLNQPSILSGANLAANMCQRNQIYFNNATGVMMPRVGNVTLGPAADGAGVQTTGTLQSAAPGGFGFYGDLEGFSACGQNVGFNPQNCDQASQQVDPASQ